uniref:Terpene synthase, N-terminal domain containing protein n=1 Tax=Oryza sativa subsp. japonica TaxID=39947 RepID=Q2R4H1_ORYSJ|nr:Terpene synthase, N-terminal domain containing protein [Oryza sativa Japonica Group]
MPLSAVTGATAVGVRNNLEVGGNAGTMQLLRFDLMPLSSLSIYATTAPYNFCDSFIPVRYGMAQFAEQSSFDNSIHAYLNDIEPLLELYKSSQVRFSEDDLILENIGSWSTKLLKQQLSSKNISKSLLTEVTHALKFPLYATLEPHEHRRNIERFKTNVFQRLKSGYWY